MIYNKCNTNEDIFKLENSIGSEPYTEIGDKAFLSCKTIRELYLPETIERAGSWAFAHMRLLERIYLPANEIQIGKEAFLDCPKLKEVYVMGDCSGNEGLPFLMAAAITRLQDMQLVNPKLAADATSHKKWLQQFDQSLITYLENNDDFGFEPVLIGWFEDEAEDSQKARYVKKQQINKAELVFLRLQYPMYLEDANRSVLENYLRDHVPGGNKEKEHVAVWDVLGTDYGKDIRNFQILKNAGVLKGEFVFGLIDYLNQHEADTEVLAYLLAIVSYNNLFDSLDL